MRHGTRVQALEPASAARGFVAGAVAGLAAILVVDAVKARLPASWTANVGPRNASQPQASADLVAARKLAALAGKGVPSAREEAARKTVHLVIAAGIGGLYGALVELAPGASSRGGLGFGLAVWLVADEGLSPILGLSRGPRHYTPQTHAYAFASNVSYGVLTEAARGVLRPRLGRFTTTAAT